MVPYDEILHHTNFGPALTVLNINGLLMERIPVANSAGWITGIFPLSDGHTVCLAGTSPTCYSEVTLLAGTWGGARCSFDLAKLPNQKQAQLESDLAILPFSGFRV